MIENDRTTQPLTTGPASLAGDLDRTLYTADRPPGYGDGAAPFVPSERRLSLVGLWHYRWSILLTFVLVTAVAEAVIWLFLTPAYAAQAKIEVSPVIPQLLQGKSDMVPMYESYRSSQVDHITGTEVLDAVLDRPQIRATNWYRNAPVTPLEKLLAWVGLDGNVPPRDRLARALQVTAPKGKQHIFVSFSSTTPGEPRLIVDAVVEEYTRFANRRTTDSELNRMEKLRNQVATRDAELSGLRLRAAELRERIGTGTPDQLIERRLLRLDDLIGKLRELQVKSDIVAQLESAGVATTQASDSGEPVQAPAARTALFESDREWQRLNQDLQLARRDLDKAPDRLGDVHPALQRLRRAVEYAEERLKEREAEITAAPPVVVPGAPAVSSNLDDVRRMRIEMEALRKAVAEETESHRTLFRDSEELRRILVQSADLQDTLTRLRDELERTEMNRQVAGSINPWAAYEPAKPPEDRRPKLALAAPAGALVGAVLLAFLRFRMSATINAADEISAPVQGAFLGYVPWQRNASPGALAVTPLHIEAIRMVRTALLQRLGPGRHIVQVTSPDPSAGKSTLSVMLARSLAQSGKRVLLVDADVRRPSLARHFQVEATPGLKEALLDGSGQAGVHKTDDERLSLVPAGVWSRHDEVELLANGVLAGVLARWRQQYDMVLLDSSPLLGTADGAILSRQVDGTVLTVRERHSRRTALVESLAALSAAGGRLLGTVFVGTSSSLSYGYSYGRSEGYAPLPEPAPRDVN